MTPYEFGYAFGSVLAQYVNLTLAGFLFAPVIVAVTLGALWLKKKGAQ